jgi:hypothetical protein
MLTLANAPNLLSLASYFSSGSLYVMFIGFKHREYLSRIWPIFFDQRLYCIQRETWGMGPYVEADYNLIVDSEVSFPLHLQNEWSVVGHICTVC